MSRVDYEKALKQGEKEYRLATMHNEDPYLPVLDLILAEREVESQIPLGLVTIPLDLVSGTYSSGRTQAFARNFMPIMGTDSEFASKWGFLYDELAEEGLKEPIKAFEFMNKFYVMEGNKRVSVLKCLGAVSIEGNVIRIVPKYDPLDEEVRIYHEFLKFYELTGFYNLQITKEGNYLRILKYTGHDEETKWTDEEKEDFQSLYFYFEQEMKEKGMKKLSIKAGDAIAEYLEIYPYSEVKNKTPEELKKDISKLWDEFLMLDEETEANIILDPTLESQKQTLISKVNAVKSDLKVAFVHATIFTNSVWNYLHELGRNYVQDVFGEKIITTSYESADEEDADEIMEKAVADGNKLIFSTSSILNNAAIKIALKYPDIKVLNCALNINHKNVRNYYVRMYEARFISGAIAGSLSRSGLIGYSAEYPTKGTILDINAFALGAQMTNPDAKVILRWTTSEDTDPYQYFVDRGADIILGQRLLNSKDIRKDYGLFKRDDDGNYINLAMPLRHWGKMYEIIIDSVLKGTYKNDDDLSGNQAVNYFWGMSSGVVDIIYSHNMPTGAKRLLHTLRRGIKDRSIDPFIGPIYSQDGTRICDEGKRISPEDNVSIDWLVDNVEGHIPQIDELSTEAKNTAMAIIDGDDETLK